MVRRELAALLGLRVAAAAGREHDRAGLDDVVAADARASRFGRLEARGAARSSRRRAGAALPRLAQRLGDRVAGAVADLQQPLRDRAAAAREPVAAVLARELDAELLEPADRATGASPVSTSTSRGSAVSCEERSTSSACCSGESSGAERGLDAALRLGGVVGLQRALRRERDAGAGALGGDSRSEAGGAAPDHEHVEVLRPGHGRTIYQSPLIHDD